MGEIMKEMSQTIQYLPLPIYRKLQLKVMHFKVSKLTIGEDTQSELKLLTDEERIIEIAQMLSGAVVSDSALNHAKALLN
jgi:DNA repair protein RecN (Recombination protein N)